MRINGIFDAKICVVKGKCGMKLSVCNIAWTAEHDAKMYEKMKELGMEGIEIAPTRIFPDAPYEHLSGARLFAEQLKKEYGLSVASMQSIWYQRTEKLFGSEAERETLLSYTKQAIDFAEAAGCPNLVFGSPKNRVTQGADCHETAVRFFGELGQYAAEHHTCLSLEANPAIYGTDFINRTTEAFALVKEVDSKGFAVNIDFGTILANEEDLSFLTEENLPYINHIHISEPYLALVQRRSLHEEFAKRLGALGYDRYVSAEMKTAEQTEDVFAVLSYMKEVFA